MWQDGGGSPSRVSPGAAAARFLDLCRPLKGNGQEWLRYVKAKNGSVRRSKALTSGLEMSGQSPPHSLPLCVSDAFSRRHTHRALPCRGRLIRRRRLAAPGRVAKLSLYLADLSRTAAARNPQAPQPISCGLDAASRLAHRSRITWSRGRRACRLWHPIHDVTEYLGESHEFQVYCFGLAHAKATATIAAPI